MATPTLQTHDVLLAAGGVTLGLFLVKDEKTGKPLLFKREPFPALADQQFQSNSEQITPPAVGQTSTIKSNHGGFGKERYSLYRYMQSHGTDASVANVLFHTGPVAVQMTKSSPTQTGYNMGFETWTSISSVNYADNWAYVYTANPIIRGTTAQGGTYAAEGRLTAQTMNLRQPLAVTAVTDTTIAFSLYARRSNATDAITVTLRVLDASDASLASTTLVLTTAYQQVTLNYTFVGTVTNPQLDIQWDDTANTVAYVDTVAVVWGGTALTTLTMGSVVKMVLFNGNDYAVSDTGVWKRSSDAWAWVGGSPPGITDAFVSADSKYLVLCRGSSLVYWLMRTNESFVITSSSAAGSKIQRGLAINNANYGTLDNNTAYKIGTLENSTVTNTYTVGDTGGTFTSIVDHVISDVATPFFFKTNFAAYISSGGSVIPVLKNVMTAVTNANTGKNAIPFYGNGAEIVYIPAGAGASLLTYDAGIGPALGPDMIATRLSDFTGQIVATAVDDQWLYIIQDNTTKIEISKARYEDVFGDNVNRWVIHPFFEDTYASCVGAYISGGSAKKLFYYGGSEIVPKYIPLATKYGDPVNDTNLTHLTSTTHETSWLDEGMPGVLKTYLNFSLTGLNLTANRTVKVEYMLWENQGTWAEVGGSGNGIFTSDVLATKSFVASISSRAIRFKFTCTTNDASELVGAVLASYRWVLDPVRVDTFQLLVEVKQNHIERNGKDRDTRQTYGGVMSQLHSWMATQPLTFTYPDGLLDGTNGVHDGASLEVKFADTYPKNSIVKMAIDQPVFEPPESIFTIVLTAMDRSLA